MTTSTALQTITALLADLTTDEKRTLRLNLNHDLLDADKQDVIDAVRSLAQAYEEQGITGVVAIEFGTTEWDNGYFLSAHGPTLIGADENTITPTPEQLSTGPDDIYFSHVDEAFTNYVDDSLGYRSRATVNLVDNTLALNI